MAFLTRSKVSTTTRRFIEPILISLFSFELLRQTSFGILNFQVCKKAKSNYDAAAKCKPRRVFAIFWGVQPVSIQSKVSSLEKCLASQITTWTPQSFQGLNEAAVVCIHQTRTYTVSKPGIMIYRSSPRETNFSMRVFVISKLVFLGSFSAKQHRREMIQQSSG